MPDPVHHQDERLERARSGDREAFTELLTEALPGVRAFLLRLGAPTDDLDDLAQEVFVTVIRGLKDFRGDSRFTTWLLGIAVNVFRRWRSRRIGPGGAAVPEIDPAPGPARRAALEESRERLARALGRLPDRLREAFVLRYVEELSAAAAAAVLGIPEGTVRRHAFEARARLREWVAPRESQK